MFMIKGQKPLSENARTMAAAWLPTAAWSQMALSRSRS